MSHFRLHPSDNVYPLVLRIGTLCRSATEKLRDAFLRRLCHHPLLNGLLSETGTLLRRMAGLNELRAAYRFGADCGPIFERREDGNLYLCTQTRACIRDTRQARELRSSVSALDLRLYVAAWKQGAKWAISERHSPDKPPRLMDQGSWDEFSKMPSPLDDSREIVSPDGIVP